VRRGLGGRKSYKRNRGIFLTAKGGRETSRNRISLLRQQKKKREKKSSLERDEYGKFFSGKRGRGTEAIAALKKPGGKTNRCACVNMKMRERKLSSKREIRRGDKIPERGEGN